MLLMDGRDHFEMPAQCLTYGLLTDNMGVATFEIMKHYGENPRFES